MHILVSFISGVMVGLEFDFENQVVVIDLGIIRILGMWGLEEEE